MGAVGSRVAEVLVRLGFDRLTIYDFDIVEDVNVTNQIYEFADIGRRKVEALTDHLKRINPHVVINAQDKYINQPATQSRPQPLQSAVSEDEWDNYYYRQGYVPR